MAEGGGQTPNNKGNPFSFKNFVKGPAENSSSDDSDFETDGNTGNKTFDLLNVTGTQKKEKAHILVEDDGEASTRKSDENPFSFKKFLQGGTRRPPNASVPTFDLANDLPEFVQNHHTSEPQRTALDRPAAESVHSLFGTDGVDHQSLPTVGNNETGVNRNHRQRTPPISDSDNSTEEDEEESRNPHPIAGLSPGILPDFLSDSNLGGGMGVPIGGLGESGSSGSIAECAAADLRTLQEENRELRCALQEANSRAEKATRRVKEIQQEMVATQKRDADETKALENMVQQVEANLVTTTKRAVKAEATIDKLKQEVATLQRELQVLRHDNQQLHGGGGSSTSEVVRDKAKYASQQLSAAATSAEQTLKQLLKGVDNMRLLSDILASIDTVTEAPPTSDSNS